MQISKAIDKNLPTRFYFVGQDTAIEIPNQIDELARVWLFVRDFRTSFGYSPSLRQMAAGLGITVAKVRVRLDKLIEAGRLKDANPGKERGIIIV